jgi:hypothetical protein
MFARFRSFDRPGDVKLVGEWIVDGLNLRVGEQLFVRSIGLRDAQGACNLLGLAQVARGNRAHLDPITLLHGRQDFLNPDCGRAQNSPANFVWHTGSS